MPFPPHRVGYIQYLSDSDPLTFFIFPDYFHGCFAKAKLQAKKAYTKAAAAVRLGGSPATTSSTAPRIIPHARAAGLDHRADGGLATPCAVVLAPTRELGQQIAAVFETLIAELVEWSRPAMMCVVGGQSVEKHRDEMLARLRILVLLLFLHMGLSAHKSVLAFEVAKTVFMSLSVVVLLLL